MMRYSLSRSNDRTGKGVGVETKQGKDPEKEREQQEG
jgi:hypothetical protein